MNSSKKSALIAMLTQAGEAFCRTIGPQCEVVIHDLSDMEHSIVWIMGTVTGRQEGGCMTSRGLSLVHTGQTADNYHYTTQTRDGKMVRSTLNFIKDRSGRPVIGFEVNFDTTPFVAFRHTLETLTDPEESYDFHDAFIDDAPEMLDTLLKKAVELIGVPTSQMNKGDRLRVVQILDEAGAMELRKAAPTIASYLGVTRFTIHNYLNEIRNKAPTDEEEAEDETEETTQTD